MDRSNHNRGKGAEPGLAWPRPAEPTLRRSWLFWGLAALGVLVLMVYLSWDFICQSGLWGWACRFFQIIEDRERVKALLKAAGPLAPLIFMAVQALQVVLAPIPGEATGFIGGYLFGVPLGMLYSTLGLTLGSVLAFALGRWLEHRFVERIVSRETLDRFDFLMERQGFEPHVLEALPGVVHRGAPARHPDAHPPGGQGLSGGLPLHRGVDSHVPDAGRDLVLFPGTPLSLDAALGPRPAP
jgi:hypothetical protein